jgi:soluble lytic murein transglycosylase-like protein
MRKSTIVVAVLAATVASANAAPNSERLVRGTTVQTKSQTQQKASAARAATSKQHVNAAAAAPVPRPAPGSNVKAAASAFTSARNAGSSASAPVLPRSVPASRSNIAQSSGSEATTSRAKAGSVARSETKRVARAAEAREGRRIAARRLVGKTRPVALERDIDLSGAAKTPAVAAAAPSGSIPGMVTAAAQRQGVSPALAHAVVKVESRYQPRATGKGGYIGLMQLSYQTARGMGFRGSRQALYEPSANLQYGMRYLAEAVRKAGGNTCAAVSKYQGGHAVRGVTSAGAVYCAKVKRFMAQGYSSRDKIASR